MKVGILGGGQLAQLLAHAAYELGVETLCLCERKDEPASRNSPMLLDDGTTECLKEFAHKVNVITLENENIAIARLQFLAAHRPVYPGIKAVAVSQDRLFEKQTFTELGIPTVLFKDINNETELLSAWQDFQQQALLKTRRFGYDGKGQLRLQTQEDVQIAWAKLGTQPLILEGFLPFDFEVSLIGARNVSGQTVFVPLIHNTQHAGILRTSIAPFLDRHLQEQAEQYMQTLFTHFDYVGVLAFEFFVKDGKLYANELAPRVHNSGHLTLDGANISQFHLHLLSILDLPLAAPRFNYPTAMLNLIGSLPDKKEVLKTSPGVRYYDYGKEPRAGRKLGHLSCMAKDEKTLRHKIKTLREIL